MSSRIMFQILATGGAVTLLGCTVYLRRAAEPIDRIGRLDWRMPPLDALEPARMSRASRLWMAVLRGYLLLAGGLVLVRIVELALDHSAIGGL